MSQKKKAAGIRNENSAKAVESGPSAWQTKIQDAEEWLRAKQVFVIAFLLICAFIPRYYYYQQAKDTPINVYMRWNQSDMEFFDQWAKVLASGNWLNDTILHPFHGWHDEFAKLTFRDYPDVASKYYKANTLENNTIDTLAAKRQFVNEGYNNKVFHQEPLYPYLIALTYKFFGPDPFMVYRWQLFLGILTVLLIYLTGQRLFGPLVGILASFAFILSGPIMVFDMVLLRTTLTIFFTILLLYLYVRALEKPDAKNMIVWGLASGLALLCQSYLLLFMVFGWLWMLWTYRLQYHLLIKSFATFFISMLIIMSPAFYRNYKVGAPTFSLASNAAITYIIYNSDFSKPLESFYLDSPKLVEIMHKTKGNMGKTMKECLATFKDIDAFWTVYKQKIQGILMPFELSNNMNYYYYKEFSPMLNALPALHFLLAPLGLAGLLLGFIRKRAQMIPVFIMILVSATPMIIGGCLSRYRVALSLILALSSSYFLLEVMKLMLNGKFKWVLFSIISGFILFYSTINLPGRDMFPYSAADINVLYREHYIKRLLQYEKENNFNAFYELNKEFLGYIPDYFFEGDIYDPLVDNNDVACTQAVIRYLNMNALVSKKIGKLDEANKSRERVDILQKRIDNFQSKIYSRK